MDYSVPAPVRWAAWQAEHEAPPAPDPGDGNETPSGPANASSTPPRRVRGEGLRRRPGPRDRRPGRGQLPADLLLLRRQGRPLRGDPAALAPARGTDRGAGPLPRRRRGRLPPGRLRPARLMRIFIWEGLTGAAPDGRRACRSRARHPRSPPSATARRRARSPRTSIPPTCSSRSWVPSRPRSPCPRPSNACAVCPPTPLSSDSASPNSCAASPHTSERHHPPAIVGREEHTDEPAPQGLIKAQTEPVSGECARASPQAARGPTVQDGRRLPRGDPDPEVVSHVRGYPLP